MQFIKLQQHGFLAMNMSIEHKRIFILIRFFFLTFYFLDFKKMILENLAQRQSWDPFFHMLIDGVWWAEF